MKEKTFDEAFADFAQHMPPRWSNMEVDAIFRLKAERDELWNRVRELEDRLTQLSHRLAQVDRSVNPYVESKR